MIRISIVKPNDLSYAEMDELKSFEMRFKYPIGDRKFSICHGMNNGSYTQFFESLGKVKLIVIRNQGKVVGLGCAILRTVKNNKEKQKFWYLCDFKISKDFQNKKILNKLFYKLVIPFYIRSKKMVAFNMSPPGKSVLLRKARSIFKWFNLDAKKGVFFEMTYYEYVENKDKFKEYLLYTNYGEKDIVIDGEISPIVHLVEKDHAKINLNKTNLVSEDSNSGMDLLNKSIIMIMTTDEKEAIRLSEFMTPSAIGTLISKSINVDNLKFSSAEV